MPYELPGRCPVCHKKFRVTRLRCANCGSALEGDFELNRLAQLPEPMREFVVSFLKCRGSIRYMEKEYGISYPTVRARIDDILKLLGEQPAPDSQEQAITREAVDSQEQAITREAAANDGDAGNRRLTKREILVKLANGEIDADAARALLENL